MPDQPATKGAQRRTVLAAGAPASRFAMRLAHEHLSMKESKQGRRTAPATEPVGIVISRGSEAETAPRFSAYVYAPVPEEGDLAATLLMPA
jgi:hypothetical protein